MTVIKSLLILTGVALLASACSRSAPVDDSQQKPQLHKDLPPHGGTPVPLGDDYNLELVHEPGTTVLTAYVLDDEMEEFVRSSSRSLTIVADIGHQAKTVELVAVASPATGETSGDTSQFEGSAPWLASNVAFAGQLKSITIRGTVFSDIEFHLSPNGTPTK